MHLEIPIIPGFVTGDQISRDGAPKYFRIYAHHDTLYASLKDAVKILDFCELRVTSIQYTKNWISPCRDVFWKLNFIHHST